MSSRTEPLTLDHLIEALQRIKELYPDYSARPVHMLDMEDADSGDSLITHVEVDTFTEEQGPVTSLMSWPSEPLERLRLGR